MNRKKISRGNEAPELRTDKPTVAAGSVRIYTVEVALLGGSGAKQVAETTPTVARTIQLTGGQSLADLHGAICDAFGYSSECGYEFQFGAEPRDSEGPRYVPPDAYDVSVAAGTPAAGRADQTSLDALRLESGQRFAYWIDCGEDWWHQIAVTKSEAKVPRGTYPKITRRVGEPPSHVTDKEEENKRIDSPLETSEAADAACLVGELHLSKGDYHNAVEAFTRALEENPTADAYEGRARAYRALAAADEKAAQQLK